MSDHRVRPGSPSPLGATWDGHGTNFAVYSESATAVDLCLFDAAENETRIPLEQVTELVWHAYVENVGPGQLYALRVDGPWDPKAGHRFNHHNVLLDPYARAVSRVEDWSRGGFSHDPSHPERDLAMVRFDQRAAPLSVVVDPTFDWGADKPPNVPLRKTIVYETHVKGLTMRHPDVPPELRGTYAGVATAPIIEHLVGLGVTAVELLPVHHFVDDQHLAERGLRNYWGYNSIAFFAPEVRYRAGNQVGDEVRQFKGMVRALHAAGIEVILDVVYNHTAEGNHDGPALCFKGIDNRTYYRLVQGEPRFYFDYTGTGNTLNVRHPHVLRLIMDSIRYWATEMHVDGFRFDLASTLARSLHEVDRLSSFFAVMNQDPALARVKLIAEPWDLGEGGYQVGHFPVRWSEWNGKYRDAMRAFWRGDRGRAAEVGARLTGSADLYQGEGRGPPASVNFVTAHDGFTLADLVSYEHKHNEANGEGNRDGADENLSSNGGVEGDTDDERVNRYRARQQRNLLASLLLSRGTPMICGGDEIGRTQRGNNNAYGQDDETNWYDWTLDGRRKALLEFTRNLIRLRKAHPLLQSGTFVGRAAAAAEAEEVEWFRHDGAAMTEADWKNHGTSSLAMHLSLAGREAVDEDGHRLADDDLLVVLNASDTDLDFVLPARSERGRGTRWRLLVDTADDQAREEVPPEAPTRMTARSLKLLARRALAPAGLTAAYGAPVSTYRLQLTPKFGFREASAIVPYLHEIGVGGVYASPVLRARRGSTHGYDVVDHGCLNPELGSREDLDAWTAELARRGMERLLDFVPNHMGIGGGQNAWWSDVLEHGASSLYADHFDIDWAPPTGTLESKVLLPVLGGQFGHELEAGRIAIARRGGTFTVVYGESSFPASPRSYGAILEAAVERMPAGVAHEQRDELASVVTAIRHLPPASSMAQADRETRARESDVAKRRLTALFEVSPEIASVVDAAVTAVNENADKLEAFLLDQNYRLASWHVASDEVNYRRFFDQNDLAAIRMEDPKVFAEAHRLVLELIARGQITGLRLDHVDGLYDPEAYFATLRVAAARALAEGGREAKAPLYVVAEKVLERDEAMPTTWAIVGTTGYDWLGAANGLWIDPDARATFDDLLSSFAGVTESYGATILAAKRVILKSGVSSEVQMLAHLLKRIADGQRRARDFTFTALVRAVSETLRAFPVYRSYVRPDGTRQPNDEVYVRRALRVARLRNPLVDPSVFDFLGSVLLLAERSEENVRFAMRFQQLTGPVMAKGLEDTATYRYVRLVSSNEVGADPGRFGTSAELLHEHNLATLSRWPLSMTTTTTHDTKLSEDVRARLAALTEIPEEWRRAVARLHELAERYVTDLEGEAAPSRLDEYLFFQVVVGAYPYEGLAGEEARAAFVERLVGYMEKATREAKIRTSWLAPNAAYDAAVARFVRGALGDAEVSRVLEALVEQVLPHGASNSLAQLAIRLASPGVPDVYQGGELWDSSLVDPDNRRPVDYERRRDTLHALAARGAPSPELAAELAESYRDGRIKMHVSCTGLRMRRAAPSLFLEGAYRPIPSASPNVFAFERSLGGAALAVVAPRLTRKLTSSPRLALGDVWGDATIDLGVESAWENVLTGETANGRSLRVGDVLRVFPVAWLRRGSP